MSQELTPGGLLERLDRLVATHPSATLRTSGTASQLPELVEDAIVGATAEALRNTLRHAPGSNVTVHVQTNRKGVWVKVRDDGPGMSTDTRAGFGLTNSINGRMQEVGGTVSLSTAPFAGTEIGLNWYPRPENGLHDALRDMVGRPRQLVALFVLPLILASWYLVLFYGLDDGSKAVTLSVALIATALAVAVVSAAGTPWVHPVGALNLIAAPMLNVIALLNAGDGALLGFRGWSVGLTGNVAIAMAASLPAAWPLATAAAISASSTWVAMNDPTISPSDTLGAILQPVFFTLAGVLVAQTLLRAWRSTTLAFDDARHSRAQALLAEVHAIAQDEQADRLGEDLGAFLASAADDLDLNDPEVKREAAVLAARVRDELEQPGAWPPQVRHALDEARRRGAVVTVRSNTPTPWPAQVHCLMTALLAQATTQRLTITIRAGNDSINVRGVVDPPFLAQQTDSLKAEVAANCQTSTIVIDSDDDAMVIDLYELR